jgi:hypothetical protein
LSHQLVICNKSYSIFEMIQTYDIILYKIINSNDSDDLLKLIFDIEEKFDVHFLKEISQFLTNEINAKHYSFDIIYNIKQFIRLI